MIVGCDISNCTFNVAGECRSMCIQVSNGFCMTMEKGESTGEIIEEESDELVYPEGIED